MGGLVGVLLCVGLLLGATGAQAKPSTADKYQSTTIVDHQLGQCPTDLSERLNNLEDKLNTIMEMFRGLTEESQERGRGSSALQCNPTTTDKPLLEEHQDNYAQPILEDRHENHHNDYLNERSHSSAPLPSQFITRNDDVQALINGHIIQHAGQNLVVPMSGDPNYKWEDAVGRCELIGGQVWLPTTKADWTFLKGLVGGWMWLPASDTDREGIIKWTDGRRARQKFIHWWCAPGGAGCNMWDRDCAFMYGDGDAGMTSCEGSFAAMPCVLL